MKPLTPAVLSIDLLNQLNKHYTSTQYKHLRTPLLQYTPEAIVAYAVIIYDYVILPAGLAPSITQKDYINYLTRTYREAVATINPILEDFIGELEAIVSEAQYTTAESEPHSISEYINYFKTGTDTPDGYNEKHFPAPHDFFYSVMTPLASSPYVNDRRINAIKYEADGLQRRHSERLNKFIWEELYLLKDQLATQKDMPTDTNPETVAQDNRIFELNPEVEELLNKFVAEANAKSQAEAEARLKQAEANAKAEARIKEIQAQQARQARKEPKTLTPDEYLDLFIGTLEPHYTSLSTKYTSLHITDFNGIARLDDMHAYILATKYAKSHNLDLDTILAQQSQAQSIILSFDNLKPILSACLQCYVYNLAIEDILTPEILEHGVIKGILEATARSAPSIARRSYSPNADLAEALYDKLLAHTHGFATALPLPDIAPLTEEEMKIKVKELTHKESVPKGDILPFDLTRHLAQVIHEMQADVITTYTEVLSASPDPSSLTPVNISTIKNIAYLLIGRVCTPYLLDGELVIYDEVDNIYYRIIPNIGEDKYAAYGFRVYNYRNLSSRIYRQQTLLMTSSKYKDRYFDNDEDDSDPYDDPFTKSSKKSRTVSDEDLGHRKYEPLPQGNPQARKEVLADLEEWDKVLTDRINDVFDDPDYDQAQAEYRQISSLQYFYPNILFISAYKLSAYVYYPQEYSDLILRKPLDPITGKPIQYHVHHVGGQGSEHDNRPENLQIITKQLNDELRYTSRPVIYQGERYNTIKSYCDRTNAGNDSALNTALSILSTGDQVLFKKRIYSIDPDTEDIIAVDDPEATRYIYNDFEYEDLKAFTRAHRLLKYYDTIQKGIKRAKDAGKTEYKHKKYRFYLDSNDITIKSI